jgi:hypothetical protein
VTFHTVSLTGRQGAASALRWRTGVGTTSGYFPRLSSSLTDTGTENVLLAVGMGEASRVTIDEFPVLVTHLLRLRLLLVSLLNDTFKVRLSLPL